MENTDNSKEEKELNNVNNELEENSNSINVGENSEENFNGNENVNETVNENNDASNNTVSSGNGDNSEPSAEEIIDVVSESIEKDKSLLINDDVVNLDIANVVAKRKKKKGKKGKKNTVKGNSAQVANENSENGNNSAKINEEKVVETANENSEAQENAEQVNEENSENIENVENTEKGVVVQESSENVEENNSEQQEEVSEEAVVNTDNAENSKKEAKEAKSGKKNSSKKKKKKKPEVSDAEEEIIAIEDVKENVEEKAEETKKESNEENNETSANGIIKVKKKHNVKKILLIALAIILVAAGTCLGIAYYDIKTTRIEFNMIGEDVVIEAGQAKYEESGVIATRNDRDIKDEVKVESNVNDQVVGEYEVRYNLKIDILAYDHTLIRHVTIHDTTPPELNVESEDEFVAYIGDEFNVPAYSANDTYDGDLTEKVDVDNQVDNTKPGTYTITYTVSDSSNNTTTKTITVKVEKKKNPKIVVSISEQTLYYYEYDQVVLTSSVVTGVNNQTPTGTFKILNKARNVDLKGDDYVSHVQYWLAFKGNSYGFHDASWRSSFGGSIYLRNGSHGCVNMPYSKVQQLYNMVSVGTPVYIYR